MKMKKGEKKLIENNAKQTAEKMVKWQKKENNRKWDSVLMTFIYITE